MGEMSIPEGSYEGEQVLHKDACKVLCVWFVSPDRIRSKDLCLHYRFMRELLCPPVLVTKDIISPGWAKKGHDLEFHTPIILVKYTFVNNVLQP